MSPHLKVSNVVVQNILKFLTTLVLSESLKCFPLKEMSTTLMNICSRALFRLSKLEDGSYGFLLGIRHDNSVYVLGLSMQFSDSEENYTDQNDLNDYDIVSNLPSNVAFCGIFSTLSDDKISEDDINHLSKHIQGIPVVISYDLKSKKLSSYLFEEGALKKAEHTEEDLSKTFLHLRLTSTIPLSCDFHIESIKEAVDLIYQKIIDGNSAFHIENTDIYILGEQAEDISGVPSNTKLDKLCSIGQIKDTNKNGINVVNFGLYVKGTNNDKSPQLAPLIKYVKKIYKHVGIELRLDSLSIAPYSLEFKQLYPILVESACRNLILNKKSLLSQLKAGDLKNISLPVTYHFLPPDCGHFVSAVYPSKYTPDQLKNSRKTLHSLLALPMDKPLFRQGNAFDFKQEEKKSGNLILNPHEGLPGSGVPEGEPCLVQGTYAYHHYMQDKCDDNGWGCAYRSLQTICSWFRFQGYTNMPVPTHKEIQQCLVNIGDKPSSFVGSKQWIGSTEVSFVLDTLLGVTCRIVNVSSGEEMTMKGGELSYHFKTQGTPIMIGGGVLAHTILGVDYNKKTGAIKFLILDPHYTGGEDLKVIQSKGWCGWKGPEFWKKDAFYNMCMPLRPKCV